MSCTTVATPQVVLDEKKILSFLLSCDKLKQNHKFPKLEKMCKEFIVKNSKAIGLELKYLATVRLYYALGLRETLFFNESITQIKLALFECPSMKRDPVILTDFAHSLYSAGRYEEAQIQFDLALQYYSGEEAIVEDAAIDMLDWSTDPILAKMTRNNLDLEELKSGLALCQLMLLDPRSAEYGDVLFILKPSNQYTITHPLTFYAIGLYYEKIKDFTKAIEHYNGALKKDPSFDHALERMAMCHLKMGALDKAKSSFDLALQLNKQNYNVLFSLAQLHLRSGMTHLCKSKLRNIVTMASQLDKIDSNEDKVKLVERLAESFFLLGVVEYSSKSETKKIIDDLFINAIKYFTMYKTMIGESICEENFHNTIGLCYFYCGEYHQALESFSQSISVSPQSSSGFYNKGMLFESIGDFKQATLQYKHALQLSPKDSDCASSVKRTNRLIKKGAFLHRDLIM